MELRQLEYFVAVAEERSFTRGALRAHVAQPGVSAQIRRLEAELGEPLLERSVKGATPTQVGAAVLPHARAALAAAGAVRDAVAEARGLMVGRVAIGTVIGARGVTRVLADFHARHPHVEVALREADSAALLDDLRSGTLDLVLAGGAGPAPPDLERRLVVDEELAAGVARDHPLARRREISLRALADHPLVVLPRGTGSRTALDASGAELRIALEASDPTVVADLAAAGLGVAVMPTTIIAARTLDLHRVRIVRPVLRSRLEWLWRRDGLGPAARALLAVVARHGEAERQA